MSRAGMSFGPSVAVLALVLAAPLPCLSADWQGETFVRDKDGYEVVTKQVPSLLDLLRESNSRAPLSRRTPLSLFQLNVDEVSNLSDAVVGDTKYYYFDVPSGTGYTFFTLGSQAAPEDADLFLKFGAKPTASDYDCRPNLGPGTDEQCGIYFQPRAGRWWAGLRTAAPYIGWTLERFSVNYFYHPWDLNPVTLPAPGSNAVTFGDGTSDLVWRNNATGLTAIWFMDSAGAVIDSTVLPPVLSASWKVVGAGDFDGDNRTDFLVRNTATGENGIWIQPATTITPIASLATSWECGGVADFNSDGVPDILWRNTSTGVNAVWYWNRTSMSVSGSDLLMSLSDTNWHIVGAVDLDFDGKPDIFWRNSTTGQNAVWFMNDAQFLSGILLQGIKNGLWDVVGVGDMNGDITPDLILRDGATGSNAIWYLNPTGAVVDSRLISPLATTWSLAGPR